MPRPVKPWRVFKREDSVFWKVQWGGRDAPTETLSVAAKCPRKEAEGEAAKLWVARGGGTAHAGPRPVAAALAGLGTEELIPLYIDSVVAAYTGIDERYSDRKGTDLTEYVAPRWKHPREITAESWGEAKLALHHSRGGPLKWRSIAHLAHTLRGFLDWCRKGNIIDVVPEIESPSTSEQRTDAATRSAMTAEQRDKFLAALLQLEERRAWRIYTFLFETWMRRKTAQRLTRRWLNFKAETITIPAGAIKNKEAITIDLVPQAAAAVREEIEEIDARRKERGEDPLKLDEPIFGRFDFHQARKRKVKRDGELVEIEHGGPFGKACRIAGITDMHGLTPHHVTRHTAATLAAEKPTATLAGLMAQGAWRSASIPEKYLHPSLKAARRITRGEK